MKKLLLHTTVVLSWLLLAGMGCKTTEKTSTADTSAEAISSCGETLLKDAARYGEDGDGFILQGAKLNGECLEIDVQYSGGCGEATFQLVWNGAVKKSLPPIATLKLLLKDEDSCRELQSRSLSYDISALQATAANTGTVKIVLKGHSEAITYSFK